LQHTKTQLPEIKLVCSLRPMSTFRFLLSILGAAVFLSASAWAQSPTDAPISISFFAVSQDPPFIDGSATEDPVPIALSAVSQDPPSVDGTATEDQVPITLSAVSQDPPSFDGSATEDPGQVPVLLSTTSAVDNVGQTPAVGSGKFDKKGWPKPRWWMNYRLRFGKLKQLLSPGSLAFQ
jgi:hypothetical protein